MSSSGPDFSHVPSDILSEIINRLEVVEFIRSGAVCRTWRNLPGTKYHNKSHIPWLMLSSRDKVKYRYFYSITEKRKYDIHLPGIGGRHCIGSSQGFLISVDDIGDLHATNPITGAHLPLPSTSNSPAFKDIVTDPDNGRITHYINNYPRMQLGVVFNPVPVSDIRDYHYKKVILSPSKDIAVAIYGCADKLVFARVGDDKWTALDGPRLANFDDATFHKGRLHAINYLGTVYIFDDLNGSKPPFISPRGPLNLVGTPKRYLVESPDGEDLFLVFKEIKDMESEDRPITTGIRVFLLDKATYRWRRMKTLGEVALFLGFNHSMSLCTRDYPALKRNSVYFTDDNNTYYKRKPELAGDMGVFNLEDGSIEPLYNDNDLDRLDWPPPIWFMPTVS